MFVFQKWYFDTVTPPGDVLICYLTSLRFLGRTQTSASAEYYSRDGSRIAVRAVTPPVSLDRALDGEAWKHVVGIDGGGLALTIGDGTDRVRIRMLPRDVDPAANEAHDIIRTSRSHMTWSVPAARAHVSGSCRLNGAASDFHGTGYHDVIRTDVPFWRLPIEELFWGRAHCDGCTVVFDVVRFRDGEELRLLRVDDDRLGRVTAGDFVFDMDASGGFHVRATGVELRLSPERILVDAPVDTAGRVTPAFIGPFLARLCGNPLEMKLVGHADVTVGDRTCEGTALWERVRWQWRRRVHAGTRP